MKNLEEKRFWIWLSLIPNLAYNKKQRLLKQYKEPKKIYNLKEQELLKTEGIEKDTVTKILNKHTRNKVEIHIKYMIKNKIDIILMKDKEYPKQLKQIYDPPIVLYCKGNKKILNQQAIAIVGCRKATEYGKKVAKYFAYHLAKQGINVVSGLANGIDSYAHIGAVCAQIEENNGNTIAILGNGLDSIYPKENERLAKQIIKQGGAILSEYPLGTKPEKMNFPARNRIISGISKGVLVVEAKEKSGSLITVDFALEQGREVFVVPGNINCVNSVGTNKLIQQGGRLVMNYSDLFFFF